MCSTKKAPEFGAFISEWSKPTYTNKGPEPKRLIKMTLTNAFGFSADPACAVWCVIAWGYAKGSF